MIGARDLADCIPSELNIEQAQTPKSQTSTYNIKR